MTLFPDLYNYVQGLLWYFTKLVHLQHKRGKNFFATKSHIKIQKYAKEKNSALCEILGFNSACMLKYSLGLNFLLIVSRDPSNC